MRWPITLSLVLLFSPAALTQTAKDKPKAKPKIDTSAIIKALSGGNTDGLAGSLRGAILKAMPNPLYEKYTDWGETERAANGLTWHGLKPTVQYKEKNDGKWKHLRVTAIAPADNLILDIRDLKHAAPGKITFSVFFACPVRFDYRVITWVKGLKVWDRSYRARCRVVANLHCVATYRVEPVSLLPDFVFRLRVREAEVSHDGFEMEHVAGIGGEGAEFLGEVALRNVRRFKPELEKDLLDKANNSIEKAADTKEVRVSLSELLKKKGWLPNTKASPKPAK